MNRQASGDAERLDELESRLAFQDDLPILVTAKDAVKIRPFADERFWYLKLRVKPSANFIHQVVTALIMKRNHG